MDSRTNFIKTEFVCCDLLRSAVGVVWIGVWRSWVCVYTLDQTKTTTRLDPISAMEAFKSLWKPRGSIAIPTYTFEDGVDLEVKALLYIYKRFNIPRASDKLELVPVPDVSAEDLAQLDRMYNVSKFVKVVLETDPHRVLVDWPKNRFRAMLVLAHMPQMEHLPQFAEPNFAFSVLEADASNDEYIRTLSSSAIYAEHNLPTEIRREIAASVLRKFKRRDLETRSLIVLEYLRLVATEIQVARIYRAMLGKVGQSPGQSPTHSPGHSPQHSPVNSRSASPVRGQSPTRSPSPVRSGSPTRPGSPTRFPKVAAAAAGPQPRLGNAPKLAPQAPGQQGSPHTSPHTSPPGSPGSPRLRLKASQPNLKLASNPLSPGTGIAPSVDAGRKHILQQARLAVRARLEKEQRALNSK